MNESAVHANNATGNATGNATDGWRNCTGGHGWGGGDDFWCSTPGAAMVFVLCSLLTAIFYVVASVYYYEWPMPPKDKYWTRSVWCSQAVGLALFSAFVGLIAACQGAC